MTQSLSQEDREAAEAVEKLMADWTLAGGDLEVLKYAMRRITDKEY